MSSKVLAVIGAGVMLAFVIELVRREKLTFRYATGWIVAVSFALFFSVFDRLLFKVARFCGFELPSNFVFFSLLGVFVLLSLLLTVFLCQQNKRNDVMVQKIGILECEMRKMKKGYASSEGATGAHFADDET